MRLTSALRVATLVAAIVSHVGPCIATDVQPRPWRGIVKAVQQAAISSDLVLPVARVGAREGQPFKTGDLLIEFDCERQRHELAALAAIQREARIGLETNEMLARRGASNRHDVEVAKARLDKAAAEWAAMERRLRGCRIVAPFDGTVVELSVNPHEIAPGNRPVITIVDSSALEIEIIMASRDLSAFGVGTELEFHVDENASAHRVEIVRIAGAVDPVSQMAKVYAVFKRLDPRVLPGMSGTASARSRGQ